MKVTHERDKCVHDIIMRLGITRYLNNIANDTHGSLAKNTPNTEQVQSETLIRLRYTSTVRNAGERGSKKQTQLTSLSNVAPF